MPSPEAPIAWLFDVDNTLLDNDAVKEDLGHKLDALIEPGAADKYWHHYEALRKERGHSDFLGTFQRAWEHAGRDPRWLPAAALLLNYPFAERLYPGVPELLHTLAEHGPVGIVSDGDAVMQPRKIVRSGLWEAVDNRVLIYQHKEHELDDIAARIPARHYVLVDDKIRLLDAVKAIWKDRVTTVFVRQGHYAFEPDQVEGYEADHTIEAIADLGGMIEELRATLDPACSKEPPDA